MKRTLLFGAIFLTALVASSTAIASNPKQMVLGLGDIPAGFKQTSGKYLSLAGVAKGGRVTTAQFKKWGFKKAYESDFSQAGGLADVLSGAVEINSAVSIYDSAAGAGESLEDSAKACSKAPFSLLSPGAKIGEGTILCSEQTSSGGTKLQVYVLQWRRENMKATLIVGGVAGTTSVLQAVKLAQAQDAKMHG